MNYGRVYAEFINDRRSRIPSSDEYSERHHIIPRAHGGSDEASNLVRLTPEDHYFAHLLLAKVHGGQMWSAVLLLAGRLRNRTRWLDLIGKTRYGYGLARRKHGEKERLKDGLKGADNGNYNPTVFRWVNLDTGAKEAATLNEMWRKYGGTRGTWTAATDPNSGKPSALGWALDDGAQRLRSSKGKTFSFVNRDGRTFTGTQRDFCAMAGISAPAGTRLVRHGCVTVCGWRLAGTEARLPTETRAGGAPARRNGGRVHRLIGRDGEVVEGKRIELAKRFGIGIPSMSATLAALGSGRLPHYRGYRIADASSVRQHGRQAQGPGAAGASPSGLVKGPTLRHVPEARGVQC